MSRANHAQHAGHTGQADNADHAEHAAAEAAAGARAIQEESRGPVHLQRRPLSGARLGAYTAIGAAAAGVPLPWVPDLLLGRVRGALLHDIAAKRGLSLTPEAREILALGEPEAKRPFVRRVATTAAKFAARTIFARIGPLVIIPPVRGAIATFALGHLFHRYVDGMRRDRSVRVDRDEALRVRRAIDQALLRVVTDDPRGAGLFVDSAPEELRDGTTKFVDGVLMTIASLPEWFTARLETAFDDAFVSMTNPPRATSRS